MLFRIEDTENLQGCHRKYTLSLEDLPQMKMSEVHEYIAKEVRKEINNQKERKLLSYSKSLGICLLKYNKYTDNELHLSNSDVDFIHYYDLKKQKEKIEYYSIVENMYGYKCKHGSRDIILKNFALDVSNNVQIDYYLKTFTGVGRKKLASPEKDKEVLLMQVYDDMVISQYTDAVYLLYALTQKYGMSKDIFVNLWNKILSLEEFRFEYSSLTERTSLLTVIKYLFYYWKYEKDSVSKVFEDSQRENRISMYYNPILQLHDIQRDDFLDSYILSDYNSNIISDWIWEFYSRELG